MILKIFAAAIILFLLVTWIITPAKTNPPVTAEITADSEVMTIFKRACYDCHSNNTTWPWYSYIPPTSLFVVDHVEHGRREMNFTEWNRYDVERKLKYVRKILKLVEKRAMPLESYLILHDEAEISEPDIDTIRDWVNAYVLESTETDSVADQTEQNPI